MSEESPESDLISAGRGKPVPGFHRYALLILWVLACLAVLLMLLHGVRDTDRYNALRYLLHAGYTVGLLWHLGRTGPSFDQLPELRRTVLPSWSFGAWFPALGLALVFALTLVSDDGIDILLLLMIVSTIWVLLAWRREIRLRSVVQGVGVALIAFLSAILFMKNGVISGTVFYLLPALVPPMYVAGGLLFDRTGLGGIQLRSGRYAESLKGVLWGGLLFVPLGLFNAAEGSPGSGFAFVTEWWMPFVTPWFSGIAEETWWRLLLLGLCFFLLRPVFGTRPALAAVAAILFSGITFGIGHGRTLERLLTTGLLYGVPMAAIFARRDWEHAVGAHYMVNMIPTMTVFLESL